MFTKVDIEKYFNAEKSGSLVFLVIGVVAVIAAIVFFFVIRSDAYKGAAVPLVLVGLLMGVVGLTVYNRSDGDRIRNVYAFDMNPGELKEKEVPRMEKVMRSFIILRYTEIALALAGLVLFFVFRTNTDKQFWSGLGISLFIMATLALYADSLAEKRGHIYLEGLKTFFTKTK